MICNFIRHGQTDWNKKRLFQGRIDVPLNETGRRQAREAGERFRSAGLHFDAVVSSPLWRALETASLISGYAPETIRRDVRLIEMDFGIIDGTPFDDRNEMVDTMFRTPETMIPFPGMERYDEVLSRTGSFLESLKALEQQGIRNILIQTHGSCMRAFLAQLDRKPLSLYWEGGLGNCELARYECTGGRFRKIADGI